MPGGGKQHAPPQQRKMLPGEKQRRRKEVIARKRLERAQDKDGLHIEVCQPAAAQACSRAPARR
jgi:hypothetical protein